VVADPDVADDTELVERLLASADAVVWSRGSLVAEHESFSPTAIHHRHPHLVITAITPFGLDGPWHDRPATEFTLQAWSGGAIGIGRGSQDRAPVHVGGQVGEWVAGAYAAAMTLALRVAHCVAATVNSSTCPCWRRRSCASPTIP
jgi:crotonobetainyl-CoA:carnitine CoA-transferase CaiB-like acyl-CoA transferase